MFGRNAFLRNVVVLTGGTASGQIISLAASPLLTRFYPPEDFGVLVAYASVLSMLAAIASLRYEIAILLPTDLREALSLAMLSLLIVVGLGVTLAVIVAVSGTAIVQSLGVPALAPYLWLIPIGFAGTGFYSVLNYWAIRQQAIAHIARTRLSQGIGQVSTQLGLGLIGTGALGFSSAKS